MEESTNVKIMSIKKNKAAQRSAKTIGLKFQPIRIT